METTKIITIVIMCAIVFIAILISKFKSGKQYEVVKRIRLFPFWLKYLGIAILISSFIIHWSNELGVLNSFGRFGLVIGLLIIALSKERNEDEMTMSIRLNAVFISFFGGIMAHIIFVLVEMLFVGNVNSVNSFNSLEAIIYILFMYVLYFRFTKERMRE